MSTLGVARIADEASSTRNVTPSTTQA